jgi:hypothetical protein
LGPIDRARPYLRKAKQGDVLDIDKTKDNVKKRNIYTNVPSSQTFRPKKVIVRFTSVPVLSKAVSLQNLIRSDDFDVKGLNLLL